MKSIKVFLTVVILATISLMVFLSELQGFRLNMIEAEKLFDQQLADTAQLLSITYSDNATASNIETKFYGFQVWKDGQLQIHSKNMPEQFLVNLEEGYQEHNFGNHRWRTFGYSDQIKNIWILVAQRSDIRYVLAENIIIKSIIPTLIFLPVAAILIWNIIAFGVSPLRKLSDQLRTKQADDLSPLSLEKQPVELAQVVKSTNDLLSRLKASFQREKRFASDAAHELRTPISALKVHLHNLETDIPVGNKNVEEIRQATDRMGYLIEQILDLNRTSPEQFITKFTKFDLYKLTRDVIAKEYFKFELKNIEIELDGESCEINGDLFSLEAMIQNLLDNARKYTPEEGVILATVKTENDEVVLQVQDSGSGVPEEKYDRLFDRFYRLGGDRHASGESGCGLGLAIVKQIVDLHKAKINFKRSCFDSGLSVSVIFEGISNV
ncbi:MAG: sensor histidine kinase [Gammaproteobacteria bacterium]